MPQAHLDSPSGQQYHIRYRIQGHLNGPYWSGGFQSLEEAESERDRLAAQDNVTVEGIFVRDVSPWRPL